MATKDFITYSSTSGNKNATVSVITSNNTGAARSTSLNIQGKGISKTISINQDKKVFLGKFIISIQDWDYSGKYKNEDGSWEYVGPESVTNMSFSDSSGSSSSIGWSQKVTVEYGAYFESYINVSQEWIDGDYILDDMTISLSDIQDENGVSSFHLHYKVEKYLPTKLPNTAYLNIWDDRTMTEDEALSIAFICNG